MIKRCFGHMPERNIVIHQENQPTNCFYGDCPLWMRMGYLQDRHRKPP